MTAPPVAVVEGDHPGVPWVFTERYLSLLAPPHPFRVFVPQGAVALRVW